MPEIKQIDWSKFDKVTKEKSFHNKTDGDIYWRFKKTTAPKQTTNKNSKVRVIKSKKVKRSRQEKLAIRDYYNTIDKIRATIKED